MSPGGPPMAGIRFSSKAAPAAPAAALPEAAVTRVAPAAPAAAPPEAAATEAAPAAVSNAAPGAAPEAAGTGRRRFLGYLLAAPTLVAAAQFGEAALRPGRASAAVPSAPEVSD